MRCRECGLELDERDRLRNGAYQCPECGAIYHTASSRKASPSPWRSQHRRRSASVGDVLQRKYWVLPLWGWAAIVLAVLIAAILMLTLGGRSTAPAKPEMPSVEDAPLTESQAPGDADSEEETEEGGTEDILPTVPETVATAGHTGITKNDFLVSFDWAMSKLKYSSALNLVSDDTSASGEQILSYDFEDWFNIVLTIDPNSSEIRYAVATVAEEVSQEDNQQMLGGFITVMYCFDNTLTASKALSELKGMIADNVRTYGTSSFVAKLSTSGFAGYTMEISGKL